MKNYDIGTLFSVRVYYMFPLLCLRDNKNI